MIQYRLRWCDSRWFSILYLLYSALLWMVILILQILHKSLWHNHGLLLSVHILVPVFCATATIYSLITPKIKSNWLITFSLFFCFVAETLGAIGIYSSVAVFVGAHVCLIIYFFRIKPFEKRDLFKLIPIYLFYLAYVLFCFLWFMPRHGVVDIIFKYGVPTYGLLLSIMLWRAICTYGKSQWLLYSVAATLFFLSDLNVILEGIVGFGKHDLLGLFIFTWATYPITITLISLFGRKTLHFTNLKTAI